MPCPAPGRRSLQLGDFLNLIGYDGVETAAKGVQFH